MTPVCGQFCPDRKSISRTPVELEIVSQIKNKVLHSRDLATDNIDHGDTAVESLPAISVGELNVPMNADHIGAGKREDIPDTDVLYVEMDLGKLIKEIPKPTFHRVLAFK